MKSSKVWSSSSLTFWVFIFSETRSFMMLSMRRFSFCTVFSPYSALERNVVSVTSSGISKLSLEQTWIRRSWADRWEFLFVSCIPPPVVEPSLQRPKHKHNGDLKLEQYPLDHPDLPPKLWGSHQWPWAQTCLWLPVWLSIRPWQNPFSLLHRLHHPAYVIPTTWFLVEQQKEHVIMDSRTFHSWFAGNDSVIRWMMELKLECGKSRPMTVMPPVVTIAPVPLTAFMSDNAIQ